MHQRYEDLRIRLDLVQLVQYIAVGVVGLSDHGDFEAGSAR